MIQQKAVKERFMDNLNSKLRSKTSIRGNFFEGHSTPKSYSGHQESLHRNPTLISKKFSTALDMHHDANINLILKVQEAQYMQHLLNFLDDEILKKLNQAHHCSSRHKFKKILKSRQNIETTLEGKRFELKKRVAKKSRVVERLKKFIEDFEQEIDRRSVELKSKMELNTEKQIQCYLSEMEYLYQNDPQSILEDTDRQIDSIKEELSKEDERVKYLEGKMNGNEDLIEKYLKLKNKLG